MKQVFDELMRNYSFMSVDGKLYVYIEANGYWKLLADSDCQRELRMRVDRKWRGRIGKVHLQELYEWLVLDAEHHDSSVFREGRHHLNFSDVAYNWNKDKLVHDRKKLYFRYTLNVPYPQSQGTGAFKRFIQDTFGNDEITIQQYQKFFGLALSDMRDLKYAIVQYGAHNTGKTAVMNLLKFLVGPEQCGAVSFSQMASEFHLAVLQTKRLNLSEEVSGTTTNRLDVFKSLCGNDSVVVSNKMKDPFSFQNRCLLVFSCNVLPRVNDPLEMQSFLERLIIFPFRYTKPRSEWDTKLLEHLCEDYPSAISFAIEGLKMLEDDDYVIKESEAMLVCKTQYAGMYNSFSMFADRYIQRSANKKVASSRIKEAYQKYCQLHDYDELSDNVWSQILKQTFGCTSCTMEDKSSSKERRIRAYKGITLSEDVSQLLNEPPLDLTVQMMFDK